MFYQKIPALLIALCFCASFARAGEMPEKRADTVDETVNRPPLEGDAERMDRFVLFREQLKSAVCDENFVSKAPSLESLASAEDHPQSSFAVALPKSLTEAEVVSFLLGDGVGGIYSDFMRNLITLELKSRGMSAVQVAASGEELINSQNAVLAAKRRVALDVCEALVNTSRLQKLLNARPSRFLVALPGASASSERELVSSGNRMVAEVIDTEGRFGHVGDRLGVSGGRASAKYLIPGWLEPFELSRVTVYSARGAVLRGYRRLSNPLTNNTQSIEVVSPQGVPLGMLLLTREDQAIDLPKLKAWALQPEARVKQIETYRARIENDAVRALQLRPDARDKVRNLQEFYKNLLQAYQLFPDEKQFDTYGKGGASRRVSLDELGRGPIGPEFLETLRSARVNGSRVKLGLFQPDPKLHAIYAEYAERLAKLAR